MYKIAKFALDYVSIYREFDGAWIPVDERNVDYKAYLAWVAEGNTAEEWSSDAS